MTPDHGAITSKAGDLDEMIGLRHALFQDLKQVLWALLLIYLILTSTGFLFGQYIGYRHALLACLAVAFLVTITFLCIFLCNVLWLAVERKNEEKQALRPQEIYGLL